METVSLLDSVHLALALADMLIGSPHDLLVGYKERMLRDDDEVYTLNGQSPLRPYWDPSLRSGGYT